MGRQEESADQQARDCYAAHLLFRDRFFIRFAVSRRIIQHRGDFFPIRLDQIRNPLGQFLMIRIDPRTAELDTMR